MIPFTLYFLSNIENAISKNVKDVDFVERYRAEIEVSVHSRFVSSSNHYHTLIFSLYTHFGPYYICVCIESLSYYHICRYWFCVKRYGAEIEVSVYRDFNEILRSLSYTHLTSHTLIFDHMVYNQSISHSWSVICVDIGFV